jgi:hypothetical protein
VASRQQIKIKPTSAVLLRKKRDQVMCSVLRKREDADSSAAFCGVGMEDETVATVLPIKIAEGA